MKILLTAILCLTSMNAFANNPDGSFYGSWFGPCQETYDLVGNPSSSEFVRKKIVFNTNLTCDVSSVYYADSECLLKGDEMFTDSRPFRILSATEKAVHLEVDYLYNGSVNYTKPVTIEWLDQNLIRHSETRSLRGMSDQAPIVEVKTVTLSR